MDEAELESGGGGERLGVNKAGATARHVPSPRPPGNNMEENILDIRTKQTGACMTVFLYVYFKVVKFSGNILAPQLGRYDITYTTTSIPGSTLLIYIVWILKHWKRVPTVLLFRLSCQ